MQLQTPYRTKISGHGSCLPERILSNQDLEKMIDTTDQWITERTGIRERRIISEEDSLSGMGFEATKVALKNANMEASEIDMILFATVTAEQVMPSTACILQKKLEALGLRKVMSFDLIAACSGFVYGLTVADQFIRTGMYKNILVVGGETLSRYIDYQDRSTCILFGDGAGAFIVSRADSDDSNLILSADIQADGSLGHLLELPNSRPKIPLKTHEHFPMDYVNMNGREIFKHAVRMMSHSALKVLDDCQLSLTDVDWLIPHQANQRIIEAIGKKLELPSDKIISTIAKTANTSAGSIPIAFDLACQDGRIQRGQIVLLAAFGGGFTSGSVLLKF